jgi:four helix bundle protein
MRQAARHFQDLIVWQKAHKFVLTTYKVTSNFPKSEIYGLTSQLRRAAVSIPANIVEGFKKAGKADKSRFLNIAQGSLEESRYYLLLAQDLDYCDCSDILKQVEEVSKLLDAYNRTIQKFNTE